jgi:hypothetical protein
MVSAMRWTMTDIVEADFSERKSAATL